MKFCSVILLFVIVEITAFQDKELQSISDNELITKPNGYSVSDLNKIIYKPHLIIKRRARESSRKRSRGRKDKDGKRRRRRKKERKEVTYRINQVQPDEGVLDAKAISADRINAKSMKADSIVADIIFADKIHGDTIIVTAKKENPSLSEYIYDSNSHFRTKNSNFRRQKYNSQTYTREGPVKSYDHSLLSKTTKRRTLNRPSTSRRKGPSVNLITNRSGPSTRTGREVWYSDFPDTAIIDTSNHPFISFQNGYVKRQRIGNPRYRTYAKKGPKTQRYKKRRTETFSNYWN